MKKNWEIIRHILIKLEDSDTPNTVVRVDDIPAFPVQEVAYNIRLLKESGYIEANISELNDGSGEIGLALARRLTNPGHELLDTIRNETVWNKIKEKFESKSIDMTFDLVISVGKNIMGSLLS